MKSLYRVLDESSDCTGVLEHIEQLVEFLLGVSFDVVRASALSGGACVVARHNLVLGDLKTDAAQKSSALRMPFWGLVVSSGELEETFYKHFKEKKHCFPCNSLPGDHQPPKRKSLLRHQFVHPMGSFRWNEP
ncbi:hypothetical protein NDU88_009318 [Pleurodeles waltl]|uniref:Uncharacterized protein n=1 Tax=Pleurodeles waltl TaxID=8319 RepID=A0AAV7RX87_PLEWA|nr:hypothetical protein NDU88_009318 [Pleurodeles waltl]